MPSWTAQKRGAESGEHSNRTTWLRLRSDEHLECAPDIDDLSGDAAGAFRLRRRRGESVAEAGVSRQRAVVSALPPAVAGDNAELATGAASRFAATARPDSRCSNARPKCQYRSSPGSRSAYPSGAFRRPRISARGFHELLCGFGRARAGVLERACSSARSTRPVRQLLSNFNHWHHTCYLDLAFDITLRSMSDDLSAFLDTVDGSAEAEKEAQPKSVHDLLVFEYAGDLYAVSASQVDAVVPWKDPAPVPGADPNVLGVIQDRGRIVVVMAHPTGRVVGDLRTGSAAKAEPKRVVICTTPRGHVGLPAFATNAVGPLELASEPIALTIQDSRHGPITYLDPRDYAV